PPSTISTCSPTTLTPPLVASTRRVPGLTLTSACWPPAHVTVTFSPSTSTSASGGKCSTTSVPFLVATRTTPVSIRTRLTTDTAITAPAPMSQYRADRERGRGLRRGEA